MADPKRKSLLITQSNYIPWKGYFHNIASVDEWIVFDDMQYTRRDWRNRNRIKTAQGLHWLSIPVQVKGKYLQKINETLVSEKDWAEKHWQTIRHSYAKAQAFADLGPRIESWYASCQSENLTEINLHFIRAVMEALEISTPILDSRDFRLLEGRNERLIDLCLQRGATDYWSGKAAQEYMDEKMFAEAGIQVHWFEYPGFREYPQVHPPFEHAVTVLDLLLHLGEEAKSYYRPLRETVDRQPGL